MPGALCALVVSFAPFGACSIDPGNTANSSLEARADTASIRSNVKDFAKEFSGNNFLKPANFPDAVFASAALMFDVELVGASFNPVDFGRPPLFGDSSEIAIDAEFQREP